MNQAATPTRAAPPASHLIYASGHVDSLHALDNTRRFWVIDQQLIDDTPPSNWVGHLVPAAKHYDSSADIHNTPGLSDFYCWKEQPKDELFQCGERHQGKRSGTPHLWTCHLAQRSGRHIWRAICHAVTDDFGWLVEVPEC